jgi:hypothetical protein
MEQSLSGVCRDREPYGGQSEHPDHVDVDRLTPEGEFGGYTPGMAVGPPVRGVVVPKSYNNLPISDSSINLATGGATAPGEIRVEADELKYVDKTTPNTAVFKMNHS